MNWTIMGGAIASAFVTLACLRDGLEGVEDKRWAKAVFNAICLIAWVRITYDLAIMALAK
jgi:hypothetical protein